MMTTVNEWQCDCGFTSRVEVKRPISPEDKTKLQQASNEADEHRLAGHALKHTLSHTGHDP